MALTIAQFLERLEASGILDGADLAAVREEATAEDVGGDAEPLVKRLHKRGQLSAYQAQALWRGKGEKLAFGNYIIEDELGRGGMGVVLKARHRRMQRYVAIKVLPAAMVKDKSAIARFQREVIAAAKLTHTNIVGAHDADEINGQHILVMEFVDGRDLSSIVKKQGPLPVEQAVDCVLQTARGLEFAHRQGVIHRDIKPANLLLDLAGTVKILDMGLARLSGTADVRNQAELTGTGTVMGTVDYMSPEQAVNTKTADARSDIYSLGITLYYLLTGKPAYDGESLTARLLAHQSSPIPALQQFCPGASANLQAVFEKMVAKKPADRYQSMTEVIAGLETCRGSGSGTAMVARPIATVASPASDGLSAFLHSLEERGVSATAPTRTAPGAVRAATHIQGQSEAAAQTLIANATSGTLPTLPPQVGREDQVARSRNPASLWTDWRVLSSAALTVAVLLAILLRSQTSPETDASASGANATPAVVSENSNGSQGDGPAETLLASTIAPARPQTPAPAVAPFDAQQARVFQEAWADHLGVPVEYTNSIGMKFMLIPPGEFLMGSTPEEIAESLRQLAPDTSWQEFVNSEGPQHKVILTQPIYLGVNEVTQAEYETVMGSNPSHFAPLGMGKEAVAGLDTARHPVEMVSWNDAAEFCAKLSQQEKLRPFYFRSGETITLLDGTGYRLPSEAEWEFACRAGTATKYWSGDKEKDLAQSGWFGTNSGGRTHAVGELKANPFGLADIHGNVWEWVQDGWDPTFYGQFREKAAINPHSPFSSDSAHVLRCGGMGSGAHVCQSSLRISCGASQRRNDGGFRVSLPVDAVKAATATASAGTPIDLLARIDPLQDRVSGEWERNGAEVVGRNEGFAVIEAPYRVPEEYDLTVEFTRHNVQGQVAVALTHGGMQFKWTLGNGAEADQFGFDAIGGKYVQSFPGAKHPELAMVSDRRYVTKVEVRRDRIIGYLDGNKLAELPTDYSNLSVGDFARLRDNGLVGLIVANGAATFHRMELKEMTGTGTLTRAVAAQPPVAPLGPAPPPAKAPFDAKQARAHQEAWARHLGTTVETTNSVGAKMILIPSGEFLMGSSDADISLALKIAEETKLDENGVKRIQDERPQHRVQITQPFRLSAHEVTVGQFAKFVEQAKYKTQAEEFGGNSQAVTPEEVKPDSLNLNWRTPGQAVTDDSPVTQVSWNDAVAFCNWLSGQEQLTPCYQRDGDSWTLLPNANGYRLPTEAEFEYACRAGTTTQYSFGDDWQMLERFDWYSKNSGGNIHPVGTKLPNAFGLFDMHGNLEEWCGDVFDEKWYQMSPPNDPHCPAAGSVRVLRGGNWRSNASYSRSASRYIYAQSFRNFDNGFRIVRALPAPSTTASVTTSTPPVVTPPPVAKPLGPAPPLAKAPFDAAQAKAHQAAWAKHLGTTVETTNSVGAKMILLPPGEFLMGSNDEQIAAALQVAEGTQSDQATKDRIRIAERPQHRVVITKPFWMGATEVTVGQFKRFSASGYQTEAEQAVDQAQAATYLSPGYEVTEDSPAAVITWNDAVAYCNWLSTQEQQKPCYRLEGTRWLVVPGQSGYRLPTEAEWEYACRAGSTSQYSFGDDHRQLGQHAWYQMNADRRPHAVGTRPPNGFGLFDLHGNVQEWCQDFWDEAWYASSPTDDPTGPVSRFNRVLRGGAWTANVSGCRAASRNNNVPSTRYGHYGFRVVREHSAPSKTASVTPSVAPVRVSADAERRVAQWVLARGGSVSVTSSKWSGKEIKRLEDLPAGPLVVNSITLNSAKAITPQEWQSLAELRFLSVLTLIYCSVDDAALASIGRIETLRGLVLINDPKPEEVARITDEGVRHLAGLRRLEQLDFQNTAMTAQSLDAIGQLNRLTSLGLAFHSKLDVKSLQPLRKLIRVGSLYLSGMQDAALADLPALPRVRNLGVRFTQVSDAGLAHLNACRELRWLDLRGTQVTAAGVRQLADHAALKLINLWETRIPPAELPALADQFPRAMLVHPALKSRYAPELEAYAWIKSVGGTVSASYTDALEPHGTFHAYVNVTFPKAIPEPQELRKLAEVKFLNVLNFGYINHSDATIRLALESLRDQPTLSGFSPSTTAITPETMRELARHQALSSLLMYGDDKLGGATAEALELLPTLPRIRQLRVASPEVTNRVWTHLAQLRELNDLNLSGAQLTGQGLGELRVIPELSSLRLEKLQLAPADLTPLAEFPELMHLQLDGSTLDDAGLEHLAGCRTLRVLEARGTQVTAVGVARLQQALPQCTVFWDGMVTVP